MSCCLGFLLGLLKKLQTFTGGHAGCKSVCSPKFPYLALGKVLSPWAGTPCSAWVRYSRRVC